MTGLPSPTVTNIVSALMEQELVTKVGYRMSTGGRKPALLELCAGRRLALGVELSAQRLNLQLIDLKGNVLHELTQPVTEKDSQEVLKERIVNAIEQCLAQKAELRPRIAGIGVGISGLVDSRQGISVRFPGVNPWPPLAVVQLIQRRFGLPTFLENNVAIRTLAELWFGAGRRRNNFLFVSVGSHIRMGIVIEGQLYRGAGGNAGELGHITYREDGPLCYCGNFGCLEGYASTAALVREANKVLSDRSAVSGSTLAEVALGELREEHIFQAAQRGDRLANSILDRILHPLGLALSSLVNLFDAEAIILGGPLSTQGELVLQRIRQRIEKHALPHLSKTAIIEVSRLGPAGGALGGGALILQQLFEGAIPL